MFTDRGNLVSACLRNLKPSGSFSKQFLCPKTCPLRVREKHSLSEQNECESHFWTHLFNPLGWCYFLFDVSSFLAQSRTVDTFVDIGGSLSLFPRAVATKTHCWKRKRKTSSILASTSSYQFMPLCIFLIRYVRQKTSYLLVKIPALP